MAFMPITVPAPRDPLRRVSGSGYGLRVATPESVVSPTTNLEERRLVDALRAGDEAAFARLIRDHGPAMLRVALQYVSSRAVAEEVVQEAWLGVLRGIGSFEGRSSLKTWIFRILTNTAMTRGEREGRTVPFSALSTGEEEEAEPAVDQRRFTDGGRWSGHWSAPPEAWSAPDRLLAAEARAVIERTIAELPPAQAVVITMRDVEGFDAEDVCNVLAISETNQRVLLHRARSRVRRALEDYLEDTDA
jgi:RNA polymerase sigma-70 factor (ECF subfamily)